DDLRAQRRRQLARLIRAPQRRVVSLEHRLDAPLVPVHGLQDVDGPPEALDVAVERVPEALSVLDGHLRIDDHDRVGKLRVDGTDDLRPVETVLPLGMRGLPAPEARPQLLDFHGENLIRPARLPACRASRTRRSAFSARTLSPAACRPQTSFASRRSWTVRASATSRSRAAVVSTAPFGGESRARGSASAR